MKRVNKKNRRVSNKGKKSLIRLSLFAIIILAAIILIAFFYKSWKSNSAVKTQVSFKEPRFEFQSELNKSLKNDNLPTDNKLVLAGSFTRAADADALKARLALNAIDSRIVVAAINNQQISHQVVLGPFASVELANEQIQLLKTLEIEAKEVTSWNNIEAQP